MQLEVTRDEYDVMQAVKNIILKNGIAEIHKEKDQYVVVEIKRKLNTKRPIE